MSTDPTPPTSGPPDAPGPQGTWHAGVLLFDGFEPLDAIGPAQVLWSLPLAARGAGDHSLPDIQVHLVAASGDPVTSAYGMVVHPTTSYEACPPLDLLIVPGGGADAIGGDQGVAYFQRHEPTLAFIRSQAAHEALVTSVCTGAFLLASAGLLAGRRGNTHWFYRSSLVDLMAERGEPFELVEERVVDDGDLVSAGGVSSGIDLTVHVVNRTFGQVAGEAVALLMELETPVTAA
jgi:cyclohexyl-isocyanide hydratase